VCADDREFPGECSGFLRCNANDFLRAAACAERDRDDRYHKHANKKVHGAFSRFRNRRLFSGAVIA